MLGGKSQQRKKVNIQERSSLWDRVFKGKGGQNLVNKNEFLGKRVSTFSGSREKKEKMKRWKTNKNCGLRRRNGGSSLNKLHFPF